VVQPPVAGTGSTVLPPSGVSRIAVETFRAILFSVRNILNLGLVLSAFAATLADCPDFLDVILDLARQRGIRPQVLASRYLRALRSDFLLPPQEFWNKARPLLLYYGPLLYGHGHERLESCDFLSLLSLLGAVLISRRGAVLCIHQALVDKAGRSSHMFSEIFDVYRYCCSPSERRSCPQVKQIYQQIMELNAEKLIQI